MPCYSRMRKRRRTTVKWRSLPRESSRRSWYKPEKTPEKPRHETEKKKKKRMHHRPGTVVLTTATF
eukprot:3551041-Rhodomonas_salina.2